MQARVGVCDVHDTRASRVPLREYPAVTWAVARIRCGLLALAAVSVLPSCGGGNGSGRPDAATGSDAASGIGPEGGTVRSAADALTIQIPSGALAAVTAVEIQLVANTAPGGLGQAFRLLP